jgi:hypothetical protein
MNTRGLLLCTLFLVVGSLLSLPARAQKRSRFVFGVGASPGVTSFEGSFGTHIGLGMSLKVGQEISNGFQFYFSALISPVGRKYLGGTLYGLCGPTIRYFMKEQPPSISITAGGDLGFWDISGESVIIPRLDSGLGPHVGLGYELSEHWNAESTLSWVFSSHQPVNVFSFWLTLGYEI